MVGNNKGRRKAPKGAQNVVSDKASVAGYTPAFQLEAPLTQMLKL